MKNIYKNLARITAAAAVLSISVSAYAHSEYLITMNALSSNIPAMVDLDKPVITETDALVPIRPLAEEAGMFTSWDQSTQTATITLYSCAWADNRIERHAAELMESANTYGLDITPYSITADFGINNNTAVLKYNYKDSDDEIISLGKEVKISDTAELVNNGTLMVPLKSSMEMFGLEVNLDNDDMAADISIPEYTKAPSDMSFVAEKAKTAEVKTVTVDKDAEVNNDPKLGKYLGRFRITHYCTCSSCNGGWGTSTAWAGAIKPGQTIAVDPNVIPKLSKVYIDGYGYRIAEDCGSGIKGNHIDMAVSSHAEAMSKGVVYADVYIQ